MNPELSEYYDIYRRRASHMGLTPQQRALKSGKREYKMYEKYSEHTVRGLKCNDNIFSGVILTHKQDENNTSLKLLTDTCVGLNVGDLVDWNESKWLVWYKTFSSYQPHDKFEIIRCNYEINWLDKEGILHSSFCHLVSSQESKVKENFRTWNELITPQPNKYLEIIMPYQPIDKNTEIMVFDEVWRLVEYDKTSVPGIIYMSFTETKLNELTDDTNQQLANADKQQVWQILTPENYSVSVGESFVPSFTLLKDGLKQEGGKPDIIVGAGLMVNEDGSVSVIEEVEETLIMLSYENALKQIPVFITQEEKSGFISGDDYIRVTCSSNYEFILPNAEFTENLDFQVSNPKLAKVKVEKNSCQVIANSDNKMGTFTLSVLYDGKEYKKDIKIISLWQVV